MPDFSFFISFSLCSSKDQKRSKQLPALYLSLNGNLTRAFPPSRIASAEQKGALGVTERKVPRLPLWYHGFRNRRAETFSDQELVERAGFPPESSATAESSSQLRSSADGTGSAPLQNLFHHTKHLQEILNNTWNEYVKDSGNQLIEGVGVTNEMTKLIKTVKKRKKHRHSDLGDGVTSDSHVRISQETTLAFRGFDKWQQVGERIFILFSLFILLCLCIIFWCV